ncbi:anti-sigma factor, partial [Pseudomonas sp. SWRI111]|nr:anti-sigma factor [Pseudomonas sp. SWRI111]
ISPAAASTLSDIPFLNKIIKEVTKAEWKETKENSQLDIKTPKVSGLENEALSQTINEKYMQESIELYSMFQQETEN